MQFCIISKFSYWFCNLSGKRKTIVIILTSNALNLSYFCTLENNLRDNWIHTTENCIHFMLITSSILVKTCRVLNCMLEWIRSGNIAWNSVVGIPFLLLHARLRLRCFIEMNIKREKKFHTCNYISRFFFMKLCWQEGRDPFWFCFDSSHYKWVFYLK